MQAVVYDAFGSMPAVRELPEPGVAADGALIAVEASGICRSDWHAWMGHDPDVRLPHVPGHELAGRISAVGEAVRRWHVGDRVTVAFVGACGTCELCLAGQHQVCRRQSQAGFGRWGSFAEKVAVEHADVNLVEIPPGIDMVAAASLGCRFATAFRALVQRAQVAPGETVAVHGCGGVGLAVIMVATAAGAAVVAVDVRAEALERASRLGATWALDASGLGDVGAQVRAMTGGGADVALDCLGSAATCAASVESLRPLGRHLQVGLLADSAGTVPVPMGRVVSEELTLLGSHGMAAHAYAPLLELVRRGRLRPELLVGEEVGLQESCGALVAMGQFGSPGITVVRPGVL